MDYFSFDDDINSISHSPLLFPINFNEEDNASYHSINENNLQSLDINPNYNADYNYNYEDETNFKTALLLKNFLKDNNSDFYYLDDIKDFLKALIENKLLNDSNKKIINDSNKKMIEKIIIMKEEEESMNLGKSIIINDNKKNYYEKKEEEEKKEKEEKEKEEKEEKEE